MHLRARVSAALAMGARQDNVRARQVGTLAHETIPIYLEGIY